MKTASVSGLNSNDDAESENKVTMVSGRVVSGKDKLQEGAEVPAQEKGV